jgi:hypothetical protein
MTAASEFLAKFRVKKAAPAAAPTSAPAKRQNAVTAAALESAIAAVSAELDSTSSTRQTLERLYALTDRVADDGIVRLDGPAPVTCAQLDEALGGVGDLPVNVLRTLKGIRAVLARAEEQDVRASAGQYVTRQELDAAIDALGDAFGCVVYQLGQTNVTMSDIISQLSRTANAAPERTRPIVRRLLDAVCAHREPERVPESSVDRLYRNQHGRAKPRDYA